MRLPVDDQERDLAELRVEKLTLLVLEVVDEVFGPAVEFLRDF